METVDLPGNDALQGFFSYSNEEVVTPELFDMSALPEGMSIYYIPPEETNMFHPKEVLNVVNAINIQMGLFFSVSNNVVPVEDILEMHNVDKTLTKSDRYNARISCHYIAWALKIHLEILNEVNNGFTWMKCFTQGFHNISKAGIFKISNGNTVQK